MAAIVSDMFVHTHHILRPHTKEDRHFENISSDTDIWIIFAVEVPYSLWMLSEAVCTLSCILLLALQHNADYRYPLPTDVS